MPYDPIQGEGHGGQKCAIPKALFSATMHVIKRLTVNYDTPRQCLNLNWTVFSIFVLVRHHMTFKPKVSPSANEFCPLRGVDWQSCIGLIFVS